MYDLKAPQVGVSKRLFIIWCSEAAFGGTVKELPHSVFFNPVIASTTEDRYELHEGCLSVPGKMLV